MNHRGIPINETQIRKIAQPETVWFLCSPLPIPMNMIAVHCWIVTIDAQWKTDRWEVWQSRSNCKSSWGYVHKNLLAPWQGISKYPAFRRYVPGPIYPIASLNGHIAKSVIEFMDNHMNEYPYTNDYHYWPGPNSNTYVQWVINQFPQLSVNLPWSAIGKKYNKPF